MEHYNHDSEKVMGMNRDKEIARLTEENEYFRKIIEVQRNTIDRLIEYFIMGEKKAES